MRLTKPTHATVVAYLALFFAMGGTAVAATGGTFILGKANTATTTTALTNSYGTALTLNSKAGTPPLATNSTTKVGRLNADFLDGLDQASFQRRVSGTCATGSYVRIIGAGGSVACEAVRTRVTQYSSTIDTSGEFVGTGLAMCPAGQAVVGGGYEVTDNGQDQPVPAATTSNAAVSFVEPESGTRYNIFYVALNNLDGTPYTAGGLVYAQCVPGTSVDAPVTAAVRSSSTPQQSAALAYLKAKGY